MQGSALLEVLITIVILAFGLLGVAGLQARIYVMEVESYQRAQAVVILDDIAERISADRDAVATYVAASPIGAGETLEDCDSATGVAKNICEIGNQLRGGGEQRGTAGVGAMEKAQACISSFTATSNAAFSRCQTGVQIDVVWQGRSPTIVPGAACGAGDYGSNDAYRRAVSLRVGTGDVAC